MEKLTRREILRRLAGLSIVGVIGGGVRAVAGSGAPEARSAGVAITSRRATGSSAPSTAAAPREISSTTLAHVHHHETAAAAPTTIGSATSVGDAAGTTSSSTASETTMPEATTASTGPQVVHDTIELVGLLGAMTVPTGQVATIVGDVELQGDLVIEGVVTGATTFALNGNGHQILVQRGGRLDLAGVPKSGWVRWGDSVSGWNVGDRLAVAPSALGKYVPTLVTWGGSWNTTPRPTDSPDVALVNGSVARPEVANLDRSISLRNLTRIHFHDGAGVQSLRHLAVVDSGLTGVLAQYPIHFHLNGGTTRGSLVDGVLVENGKNHAFVPHGSHGITMRDCVAYRTIGDAFWWDPPEEVNGQHRELHTANNSNDTSWEHCLVLDLNSTEPFNPFPLSGFLLGAGSGNRCIGCAVSAVRRGTGPSGFHWPSRTSDNVGGNVWEFSDCVAHNIENHGIFVWQNSPNDHLIKDSTVYRVGRVGIDHGAYINHYHYRNVVIDQAGVAAMNLHPVSVNGQAMQFEDIRTNGALRVNSHTVEGDGTPTIFRRCTFSEVIVDEVGSPPPNPSVIFFEDCGLVPAAFTMVTIHPNSIFEIYEGGGLVHRWAGALWT